MKEQITNWYYYNIKTLLLLFHFTVGVIAPDYAATGKFQVLPKSIVGVPTNIK